MNSKENQPSEKLLDINNNKENSPDITKINLYKIIDVNNINFNNVYRTIKMMSVFFLFITKINRYKIIDVNNINFNNVYRTIKMMSVYFLFITQNDVLFDLYLLKYKIAKNIIELCRRFICVWVIL